MFNMTMRRNISSKYFIGGLVGVVLYCEWMVYLLHPVFWNKLECEISDASCVKVLFVADPQIQGEEALTAPLTYFVNGDSDRYLKSTFQMVMRHFNPDVIVYLGDLTDEGSIASEPQFHRYVQRLSQIYQNIPDTTVQVWLPGDNDIGGENEPIKKKALQMFNTAFSQPDVIHHKNISFYKVNSITHYIPKEVLNDNFKVVLSHYPVTANNYFGQQVNNAIRPHIYFCAHDHVSKFVTQTRALTFRETRPLNVYNQILDVYLNLDNVDEIFEIYVPTCSYRMGTSNIGYGAAVFEKSLTHMKYMVFWSPQRFPYLFLYLVVLIVLIIYLYTKFLKKYCATALLYCCRKKT